MREPMSWAIPLFRAFGIGVKVHVMYIVMMLGFFLRAYHDNPTLWFDFLMVTVVMVFSVVLIHEFGHCFAARYVGGEADEILMWPLGGLAFCRPPHAPMANFITTAGGPATHVVACTIAGMALLLGGFIPPLNPLRTTSAYSPVLTGIQDNRYYASPQFSAPLVAVGSSREIFPVEFHYAQGRLMVRNHLSDAELIEAEHLQCEKLPTWALWTARFFWLNLFLFCFNVFLPAYPLDGGRMLQEFIWARTDYERGTIVAAYAGIIVGMLMIILAIALDYPIQLLAIFMWYCSYMELKKLSEPEGDGFYDSSKGYMGFEDGDVPPARPQPKKGLIRGWLQARMARRIQREIEEQQADDDRMDELLAKLHREGKGALNADEQRFMDRMAERLRKKDE